MRAYWFEEYRKCGCVSEKAARKSDLPGYCPTHGNDRSNVFRGVGNSAVQVSIRQVPDDPLIAELRKHVSTPPLRPTVLESANIKCPFCGEKGYDKPGLWAHLNWCEEHEKAGEELIAWRRKLLEKV